MGAVRDRIVGGPGGDGSVVVAASERVAVHVALLPRRPAHTRFPAGWDVGVLGVDAFEDRTVVAYVLDGIDGRPGASVLVRRVVADDARGHAARELIALAKTLPRFELVTTRERCVGSEAATEHLVRWRSSYGPVIQKLVFMQLPRRRRWHPMARGRRSLLRTARVRQLRTAEELRRVSSAEAGGGRGRTPLDYRREDAARQEARTALTDLREAEATQAQAARDAARDAERASFGADGPTARQQLGRAAAVGGGLAVGTGTGMVRRPRTSSVT